jgi:cytochrome P450
MNHDWLMTLAQPGHRHTEQTKIFKRATGPQTVSEYNFFIEDEARKLVGAFSGYSGDPFPILAK